jgi:Fe2+ transport system protein FeoA
MSYDMVNREQQHRAAVEPHTDPLSPLEGQPLARVLPGQRGRITMLSPDCTGAERRRLMDLGLVPGTVIEVEMTSPLGDPTAYRVRGAQIALRREQARLVQVTLLTPAVGNE